MMFYRPPIYYSNSSTSSKKLGAVTKPVPLDPNKNNIYISGAVMASLFKNFHIYGNNAVSGFFFIKNIGIFVN